jgi:hypothetical protein
LEAAAAAEGTGELEGEASPRAAVGTVTERRVSVSCECAACARQSEAHVASADEVGRKTAGFAPREDCEAAFVHMAGKDLEGEDDLLLGGRQTRSL